MIATPSPMTDLPRPSPPPATSKAELRAWARAARDATPVATRANAAAAIADTIDASFLATLAPGSVIALFAAMGSELDLRALDGRARARGLEVAYPRVIRGQRPLAFHLAAPGDLRPATFGVPEPLPSAPAVALDAIRLVVVPGLAFTAAGARLGWGAGHYDATLPATAGPALGVVLAALVVDALPEAAHDRRVDQVITEHGVVARPGSRS